MGSINSYSLYKAKMISKESYEECRKCELYCYVSIIAVFGMGVILNTIQNII